MSRLFPFAAYHARLRRRREALLLAALEPHRLADVGLTPAAVATMLARTGGTPRPRTLRPY